MPHSLTLLLHIAAIGIGATLLMDGWTILRKRLLGVPSLDYALLGRWIGHMPRGQFRHAPVGKAAPVAGELALGWFAHYATGILFAAMLLGATGRNWLYAPTPLPALAFGLATVLMPFLLMQPAFGLGIAAAKTTNPTKARLHSLATHAIFGLGLFLSALVLGRAI
ncbi:MAG: DUF2938 domain-containing protein [Pseudomonas sp.]